MDHTKTSEPTSGCNSHRLHSTTAFAQDRFYNRVKGAVKSIRKKGDGSERSPSAEKLGPGARSPYLQRRKKDYKLRAILASSSLLHCPNVTDCPPFTVIFRTSALSANEGKVRH